MDLVNAKKQDDFGSTYDLHSALMATIWGPGINIFILLVLYSYRKYYIYIHSLFGLFITIFTISTALPILLTTGILSTTQSGGQSSVSGSTIYAHYIVGIISMASVLLVAIFGIATNLMNVFQAPSIYIIISQNVHRILGYLIAILAKSNVYIIYGPSDGSFWLFFVQDLLFASAIVARKLIFPKMEHVVIPKKTKVSQFFAFRSEKKDSSLYCVFANKIYSLQTMKESHPGGYEIVQSVKNRDIDRFIYGMYGSEAHPEVGSHSHSFRSLELLGKPIGQIKIPSIYAGFDVSKLANVRVQQMVQISKSGMIFELKFQKQSDRITSKDYEDISQLGRFHSLTINKVTRLYTTVSFLSEKNKRFMRSIFDNLPKDETFYQKEGYSPLNEQENNSDNHCESITFLIKSYPAGKLTQNLINNPTQQAIISSERGEGLKLQSLPSGKIIILAGGTGLFPFYDFIDLYFKSQIIRNNSEMKEKAVKISPILNKHQFYTYKVDLYLSVNSLEDIHPIILNQLVILLKYSDNFTLTLRAKLKNSPFLLMLQSSKHFKLTDMRFEEILEDSLNLGETSKIYICGPPRMNESLSKYFKLRSIDSTLYHFL